MHEPGVKTQMIANVLKQIEDSARVKKDLAVSGAEYIVKAAELMIKSIKADGKIFFCGNGGSAADSQHIATELISRLRLERDAIPALALTTNTSTLTAIANDYDFSQVFVRQLEAFGKEGDVLIGISTSGDSKNVIAAMDFAKNRGIKTVAMTGGDGGKLAGSTDISIVVPSQDLQRIQEAHIMIGHILCDLVEQALFG